MKQTADDTLITAISMPGTHDSVCRYTDFSFISQTQRLSVAGQLNAGVRYFDFRFRFAEGRFLASHSITYSRKKRGFWNEIITAEDVVNDCIEFLEENPSETVLFQLKEESSSSGDAFFSIFYEKFIEPQPEKWYLANSVPSMGEVRGKITLLRAVSADRECFTDENSGIDFTSYPYVGTYNIDDWRRGELKKLSGTPYGSMLVQDSYKSEGKYKWQTVTRFIESGLDKTEFNICYTSCTRIFVPRINVRKINKEMLRYSFSTDYCGIVVMDFITEELCRKIVDVNSTKTAGSS